MVTMSPLFRRTDTFKCPFTILLDIIEINIAHYNKCSFKNSFNGSKYSASRFQCWEFS